MNILASFPTQDFAGALLQIEQRQARDDETIHPLSRTRVWSHGKQTKRALLYLQGYTDSVHQFAQLGEMVFERGWNVYAPRLPYHGYKERMTDAHSRLTTREMLEWASQAVDAARGLGEELIVMGLSLGGVLATWVAEQRADVQSVLIVAPAYGTSALPISLTPVVARTAQRLPNFFIWWDPRVRERAGFDYTYPRFCTHTLARAFALGDELLRQARKQPPAARQVWMITNANDFAVNNKICYEFISAWRAHNTNQVFAYEYPRELGIPHDIMDPGDPLVKPEVVYPPLVEILEQNFQGQ